MTVRDRLILAVDVDRREEALALADLLTGSIGMLKVGLELLNATGPSIVREIRERSGLGVFYDGKFHDIPNTVAGAVRAAVRAGANMLNVHAAGGMEMMKAAGRAAAETAAELGINHPVVIAVTVLTSLDEAALRATGVPDSPSYQVLRLAREADQLDGIIVLVLVAQLALAAADLRAPGQNRLLMRGFWRLAQLLQPVFHRGVEVICGFVANDQAHGLLIESEIGFDLPRQLGQQPQDFLDIFVQAEVEDRVDVVAQIGPRDVQGLHLGRAGAHCPAVQVVQVVAKLADAEGQGPGHTLVEDQELRDLARAGAGAVFHAEPAACGHRAQDRFPLHVVQ